jgi:hypothetical protein
MSYIYMTNVIYIYDISTLRVNYYCRTDTRDYYDRLKYRKNKFAFLWQNLPHRVALSDSEFYDMKLLS